MSTAEQISNAIAMRLTGTQVAKSEKFRAFCTEAGHDLEELGKLKESVSSTMRELFPTGAESRKKAAITALCTLKKSLLLMTPAERFDLFSSVSNYEVRGLLGVSDDDIKDYHAAVMRWLDVLAEMKIKPVRKNRKEHANSERVRWLVNTLAYCWLRNFGTPKSSKNSPFYFAVEAACVAVLPRHYSPSFNTVAKYLNDEFPTE